MTDLFDDPDYSDLIDFGEEAEMCTVTVEREGQPPKQFQLQGWVQERYSEEIDPATGELVDTQPTLEVFGLLR
jgi:hypothetical protein